MSTDHFDRAVEVATEALIADGYIDIEPSGYRHKERYEHVARIAVEAAAPILLSGSFAEVAWKNRDDAYHRADRAEAEVKRLKELAECYWGPGCLCHGEETRRG